MRNKREVLKKTVGLTLLLSMALNPMAVMANELPRTKVNATEAVKLAPFNLEGFDEATGNKITEAITLKVKVHPTWSWGDEEEYIIKSVNGVFDFSAVEDKDNLYSIEIVGESNYELANIKKDDDGNTILKFDKENKIMRTSNLKGDEVDLTKLVFKNTKAPKAEEPKEEAPKSASYKLEAIDKATGNKIDTELAFNIQTHEDWVWDEVESYTIKSVDGVFDFSKVSDKDTVYAVDFKNKDEFELANLKKDNKGFYIIKFDREGHVKTSNMDGDEVVLENLLFEKKAKVSEKENEKGTISVVFEDGTKVTDAVNFLAFNKENKDMADYVTADGMLTGVKANVGDRMKLGLSPNETEKYILKTDNGYENFVWFKLDEQGNYKLYDEITGKTLDKTLDKLVVVKKADLIGKTPENKEMVKKTLKVMDNGTQVTEDAVKFLVMGGGETKEVLSKDGVVELDLYKDTEYTVVLVRTIENPYKMSGFKFMVNTDGNLEKEGKKPFETLDVYQGSYLVRLYVIQGGRHVAKSMEFNIEEIGGDTQVRKNENKFLNFDAKIGKSYKITMKDKDDEYFLEKPLEFTMEKYEEDGLYWPRVPEGVTTQGENRKVKAVFLKRYDGVDNHIVGLDDNFKPECPECENTQERVCEVSKVKVNTLPISVKLPEGTDKNDVKFKLFNSSKQQFEGEFTIDENGKLPALELFENNSYFLQLVSDKYFMNNKHFEAIGEGKLPFAFKDNAELKELVVENNTKEVKNDGTYEIDIKFVKDDKALVNEEIQFIGTIHTTKATTDSTGHVKVKLMEDVTYVAKPTNEDLVIDTFPIVVKDKTEWGVPGAKYVFDHSSCGSAQIIKVKNKLVGRTNGSVTCKPGNTTIKGMDFKDLLLVTDHLDKSKYPQLNGKDFMLLDLVLFNNLRENCERSKIAYGDFEILRKLPAEKKVVAVYYLNGETKEELKFVQSENIVKITDVHSIGVYPLVIEFENNEVTLPEEPNTDKVEASWIKMDGTWYYKDSKGNDVYKDSFAKIDGSTYRFDKDGKMLANEWEYVDGNWYWLESNGSMASNKWVLVDGNWYWLNSDGKMLANEWEYIYGKWYWFKANGSMASNEWEYVDGQWYRFEESGRMKANEWTYVDGQWYWLESTGSMASNEWAKVDGKWYWFKANGSMASNEWVYVNGDWFRATKSGRIAENEWVKVSGKWYYAQSGGYLAMNTTLNINGTNYSFDESGALK